MPIDVNETIKLSQEAADLIIELREALSEHGESGKRISKAEAGRIARKALRLAGELIIDVID